MTVIRKYILPSLLVLILCVVGVGFNYQPVQASSQVIFGGYFDPLNKTLDTVEYAALNGGYTWNSNSVLSNQIVASSGKISSLYVELDAEVAGAGSSYTFTLMYDGSPSLLTCTIAVGASSANDVSHQIDVVAGKTVSLKCVTSHTAPSNTPNAQWSLKFGGATAKESLILCAASARTTTSYGSISQGYAGTYTTSEVTARQVCPTAGTIKNLYVSEVNGTNTGTWTITVNKNSIAQALTCAVTVAAPTNSDLGAGFPVAGGDTVSLTVAVTGTVTAGQLAIGMTFVADTDGESIILGGTWRSTDTANVMYNNVQMGSQGILWNATEANVQNLGQVCVLKNLYVLLNGAPGTAGSGKAYDFTVRDYTGHSTAITCQILNAATSSNDISHTATLDLTTAHHIALMCTPSVIAPTARAAYWGLVCYIAPPATGRSFGIIIGKR